MPSRPLHILVWIVLVAVGPAGSAMAAAERDEEAARRQQIQEALDLVRKGTAREKGMALGFLSWALRFDAIQADPNTLSPILAATRDRDPRVREAAVASLAGLPIWAAAGSPYASRPTNEPRFGADELLAATKDPSPGVRLAAIQIVGARWRREDLLLEATRDSDPWVRTSAAAGPRRADHTQGWGFTHAAGDALLALLQDDSDWRFRFSKIVALRLLESHPVDPRSASLYIRLAVSDPALRGPALRALTAWRPPKVAPPIRDPLKGGPLPGFSLGTTETAERKGPVGPPSWWLPEHLAIFQGFLQDPDPDVRRIAAAYVKLAAPSPAGAAAALLKALEDPDAKVRYWAIENMGPLVNDPQFRAHIERAVTDPTPSIRMAAARVLPRLDPVPPGALASFLRDPHPSVRDEGLRAWGKAITRQNGESYIPLFVPHLGGSGGGTARAVLSAVRDLTAARQIRFGPPAGGSPSGAAPRQGDRPWERTRLEHPALWRALLPLLRDPRAEARVNALLLLGGMYAPDLPDAVAPLLADGDPGVRKAALQALDIGQFPALLPTFVSLTGDPDPGVRGAAVSALVPYLGDPRARRALLAAARDQDGTVRRSAITALARLPQDAEARQALLQAARDSDPKVASAAARWLQDQKVPEYEDLLIAELRDPRQDARGAMQTLAKMKATRAIPDIARLLEPSHPWFKRESAAWALWELRDPAAVGPLMAAFRWTGQGSNLQEGQVKVAILNALMGFRDQRSLPLYLEASRDPDDRIRSSAAYGLGALGGTDARDRLIGMVRSDTAIVVRRNAVMALEKLGNGPVTTALIAALQDKDSNVRYDAAKTLGQRRDRGAMDPLLDLLQAHAGERDYVENAVRGAVSQILEPADADRIRQRLARETHPDTQKFLESLLKRISDPKPGGR